MIDIDVIKEGKEILKECKDAVYGILGHEPNGEEIRLVNTLFIWVTKEMYFKKTRVGEKYPEITEEPATQKQLDLLTKLKIPYEEKITKMEASQLISKAIEKEK
jgi:hypothetical protein